MPIAPRPVSWLTKRKNTAVMQTNYNTSRLLLDELKLSDAEFIMELVNTPE